MPQKLPVQVLQQDRSAGPANSDQFSDRALLLLEVLEQHAAINEVETLRGELHRMGVSAHEPCSRIVAISPNRFRDAIWTDIYARSSYRRMQCADRSQNDARPAANGEHLHAWCDVASHILLNPRLRIDLCFQPRCLTRVVHDVINRCGLNHRLS